MVRSLSLAAGLGMCAASAQAAFVGGAIFSDSSWNAAAQGSGVNGAIVFRMYAAFDRADDRLLSVFDANFEAKDGKLYQDSFGDDKPPNPAFFDLAARGFGPREIEADLGALLDAGLPSSALAADPASPERVSAWVAPLLSSLEAFTEA